MPDEYEYATISEFQNLIKQDDPIYKEGFKAGAASRDADIADWRSQAHRSQSEADNAIAERDQLREQVARLRKQLKKLTKEFN